MAGKKSPEEQLAELEKKMEQLKARKQQLRAKANQEARKERTRRLIQIGAIVEKYFNVETVEEAEEIAKCLLRQPKRKYLN